MEGGGGCCIARYAAGGCAVSQVDRIMLRFRPIAPKPATQNGSGSLPGGCVSDVSLRKEATVSARGRAAKRRFGGESRRGRKKRVASEELAKKWVDEELVSGVIDAGKEAVLTETGTVSGFSDESVSSELVTLPLFAENPSRKISPASSSSSADSPPGVWSDLTLSHNLNPQNRLVWFNPITGGSVSGDQHVVVPQPVRPVGSSITVECITDTYLDRTGGGSLDLETLPGYVSDTTNRVRWTNRAYRMLVGQPEICETAVFPPGECMVALWMKEKLPENCTSFTCRVRVKWGNGKERNSLTAPCDVWRMGDVLAWRLDVKAALSLGR